MWKSSNILHALIDKKVPAQMKSNLKKICSITEFSTTDIVYEAISGHPDIFFCKTKNELICAKNTPIEYIEILNTRNINYLTGTNDLKNKYPDTARYNAVVLGNILIHNIDISDDKILKNTETHINTKQGYTRCNLVFLDDKTFFTSDKNIYNTLSSYNKNHISFRGLYIDPAEIKLPSFKNGFIGGTCGLFDKSIVFAGSLKYLNDGEKLKKFITATGYEIIELDDAPLFDCGSILFL